MCQWLTEESTRVLESLLCKVVALVWWPGEEAERPLATWNRSQKALQYFRIGGDSGDVPAECQPFIVSRQGLSVTSLEGLRVGFLPQGKPGWTLTPKLWVWRTPSLAAPAPPPSAQHWSWWFCSLLGASSCSPTSPHSST